MTNISNANYKLYNFCLINERKSLKVNNALKGPVVEFVVLLRIIFGFYCFRFINSHNYQFYFFAFRAVHSRI